MSTDIEAGAATAVFVSLVYDSPHMPLAGAFVSTMVETCRRDEAQACVRSILRQTVADTDWLRASWPGIWNTL